MYAPRGTAGTRGTVHASAQSSARTQWGLSEIIMTLVFSALSVVSRLHSGRDLVHLVPATCQDLAHSRFIN
jgi:hypothetical protein